MIYDGFNDKSHIGSLVPMERRETPKDGYGAGYVVYRLATDLHELCCLIGCEAARQEIAELINAEFNGRRK